MGETTRTLIATFQDYSTACQAARDLTENGVPQDAIYIDSDQKTTGAGSSGLNNRVGSGAGFSQWWESYFGSDREQTARTEYEGAIARGGTVLRAVVDEQMTDRSTDILNQHGAAEIETRSQTPTTAPSEGTNRRGGVRIYSHDRLFPAEPRSASTVHSTSFKRGSDSVLSGFGMTPGSGTLAGEATAGSAIQDHSFQDLTDQEELSDYKRHFGQNFSGRSDFNNMLPAYDFGARTAEDERYRKMSWEDAEAEVRSNYEYRRAALPWEEARPAVRYGWERGRNR